MPLLPKVMGMEEECSLLVSPGARSSSMFPPTKSECIGMVLRLLLEKYGAVPFGMSPEFWRRISGRFHYVDDAQQRGVWLPSEGRFYRDNGDYIEASSATEISPFTVVRRMRRQEQILGALARYISQETWRGEARVAMLNAVSDRKGKSCGIHTNFCITRELFRLFFPVGMGFCALPEEIHILSHALQDFIAWQVLRLPLTGAGKVGSEFVGKPAGYQISERADFVGGDFLVSMDTIGAFRPLVNTRDESLTGNSAKFGRLHVINGEGVRLWSRIFSVGITALLLMALEDDALALQWYLEDPIESLHGLSRDIRLEQDIPVRLRTRSGNIVGKKPLALLGDILANLERYVQKNRRLPWWCQKVLEKAREATDLLGGGKYEEAGRMLDWLVKMRAIKGRIKRAHPLLDPDDTWLWPNLSDVKAIDLQYHRFDDERVWKGAALDADALDFEKLSDPSGQPDGPDFWRGREPAETSSWLLWLFASHSDLRGRSVVMDWHWILMWEDTPDRSQTLRVLDPRGCHPRHLRRFFRASDGTLDFSTPERRAMLLEVLRLSGAVAVSGRTRLVGHSFLTVEDDDDEYEWQ